MINKIRTLLDLEVKLEERKLENGTVVEADSFEKGRDIFIKTDDEKVAMPVGEYILESGELIVVEEEGVIADVREVSDEVPQKEEETSDLEESPAEKADWAKSYEELKDRVDNLEDAIADLKGDKEPKSEEVVEAEEETPDVNRQPKSRTIKEEFSDEVSEEKLKEELSEPAVEPIKHSPEAKVEVEMFSFSQKRKSTTMDRILDKIINN